MINHITRFIAVIAFIMLAACSRHVAPILPPPSSSSKSTNLLAHNDRQLSLERYSKVDVYYYGWDVETRSRLPINAVRSSSRIQLSILNSNEIARFADWLELGKMKQVADAGVGDPRLVIDFYDEEGGRTTYYASFFRLYSEDSQISRQIDHSFRDKFHF